MIFWLDAQLPPSLANWLSREYGVAAFALRDLGLRDADDRAIFKAARETGAVVLTKDSDFVDLVELLGIPPQILWITCGNASNQHLMSVIAATFPDALRLLKDGEPVIEIADSERRP